MHLLVQMQGQKVTNEDFGPRLENNLKIPNSFTNPRLHFVLKAISYLTWTPPSEVHHPVHLHGLEHGSRCQGGAEPASGSGTAPPQPYMSPLPPF